MRYKTAQSPLLEFDRRISRYVRSKLQKESGPLEDVKEEAQLIISQRAVETTSS